VVSAYGVARFVSGVTMPRDARHGGLHPNRIDSRHGDKKRDPAKPKHAVQ
jgi:hypothetical protein